ANHIQLVLLVAAVRIGDKSLPTQQQPRIAVLLLNWNLRPFGVGLYPVGSRPPLIQIVERAIARLEPVLKLLLYIGAKRFCGILVADLPADDVGVMSVALRHLLCNAAAQLTIF